MNFCCHKTGIIGQRYSLSAAERSFWTMTLLCLIIMIFFFIVISIIVCHMSHHRHEICFWRDSPQWARASSFTRFLDDTTTHHRWLDSSGRVISSSQRPLSDITQHTKETVVHAPGGVRTRNLSKQAATQLHALDCAITGIGIQFLTSYISGLSYRFLF